MKSKLLIIRTFITITSISALTVLTSCGKDGTSAGVTSSALSQISTGPYVDQVKALAENSACANYSWKNRGIAPAGYIKGVALSFARGLCRLHSTDKYPSPAAAITGAADSQNSSKDALAYYQNNLASLPIQTTIAGQESMRATYVLGMGLGMRESSGKYCEGWDKAAGANRSSSAGEAGLYQTSYDSMTIAPALSSLYAEYKNNSSGRCFLNVFKEGASCADTSILGTGAGADYQVFNKACPAFAVEYAMTMLRLERSHYGPINRQEAEVVPACNQLLQNVEDLINSDPQAACENIL
jgi:hypothetical protein